MWRSTGRQVTNSTGHRPFGEHDCRVADQENASPLLNISSVICSLYAYTGCAVGNSTPTRSYKEQFFNYDTGELTNPMEKNPRDRGKLKTDSHIACRAHAVPLP